jgi:hypothetical protein
VVVVPTSRKLGVRPAILQFKSKQTGVLRVISRTSVMRYKGALKPLPEIARELKVDAVIEALSCDPVIVCGSPPN